MEYNKTQNQDRIKKTQMRLIPATSPVRVYQVWGVDGTKKLGILHRWFRQDLSQPYHSCFHLSHISKGTVST